MNRHSKKTQRPLKPFFTRFLDQQDLEKVTGGGKEDIATTLKYPSDNEDSGV
jgi:Serine endopeptidase inhibitors